jgi:hypothetical protein
VVLKGTGFVLFPPVKIIWYASYKVPPIDLFPLAHGDFLSLSLSLSLSTPPTSVLLAHIEKSVSKPAHFNPEDESRMTFQNMGMDQQNYTVPQPRRQHS